MLTVWPFLAAVSVFGFFPNDRMTINFGASVEIELAPLVIAKAIEFFKAWEAKYPNATKNVG